MRKASEVGDGEWRDGRQISALRRFAPYYNASSSSEAEASGGEIQILIATDVLSEGLNLQDATKLINYDIHWNPVRLMQRIGRVDRRMNEDVEAKLLGDHPELEEFRGKVTFWNFVPTDDLNAILSLYHKVTGKVLTISQTLGIEYGKLLEPDDDFRQLEEFNASYEGKESVTEQLRNELRKLEKDDPALEVSLRELPDGVFSGKEPSTDATGVFLCVQLPRFDRDGNFSLEAGRSEWYFVDLDAMDGPFLLGDIHATEIAERIRCPRSEPRKCVLDDDLLFEIRKKILRHVKDTWLKQINAPTQPAPVVKAWMEVKGG